MLSCLSWHMCLHVLFSSKLLSCWLRFLLSSTLGLLPYCFPCFVHMSANSLPNREDTRFLTVEVHNIPQVGNHVFQMSMNAITDDVKQRVVDLMFAAGYYSRRPWFRLSRRIWLAPDPSDPTAIPQAYFARCPYYRALQSNEGSSSSGDASIVLWFQWTTPDSFRNPPHLDLPRDTTRAVINVTD